MTPTLFPICQYYCPTLGLLVILIAQALLLSDVSAQDGYDTRPCTLCVDGSSPDTSAFSEDLEWSCADLVTFSIILKMGDTDCKELQVVGFKDCGCPTYPDDFCTVCPNGFSDIPDGSIKVTDDLTCNDVLFVHDSFLEEDGNCADLVPLADVCGCPAPECSFCSDGSIPENDDKVLPYISTTKTTCGSHAHKARDASASQCSTYTTPSDPVDVQSYCGCLNATGVPSNLCTLCPMGAPVVNPDVILQPSGITCSDMEDYLSFMTDPAACQAMADPNTQQLCCQPLEPCPVCGNVNITDYSQTKLYEPYDMTCDEVGLAEYYGHDEWKCSDVQTRFPFFCGCPNATSACSLCDEAADNNKEIPLLDTTCQEINDYLSISTASECNAEKAKLSVYAAAYCGCPGATPPMTCQFCETGQTVQSPGLIPGGANGVTCEALQELADYAISPQLCDQLKDDYSSDCCSPSV